MILPAPSWSKAPEQPVLLPGEIHLWKAPLGDTSRVQQCLETLSRDELLRVQRFVFEEDRNAFILSHAALRMVLARYLFTEPHTLEFARDPHGKPTLVQQFTDLRFNLSHSTGLALIAVARGREVGVDVEWVNREILFEEIAEHYFEPTEVWDVRTAPSEQRVARFFDVWTRKEAALKATGAGLTGPRTNLEKFAVRNVTPADGYSGAVASEGEDWQLACWEWSF